MADPAVAAAMAAACALLSPGDPATLVAADAHLRAVNDSPDGWRIGRALLSCAETPGDVLAPRVRVMGAAMLRAKAHADGFAMTPPDAASMTSELLAMLGTPEGSGELGPHLAQIAAAVATAGGAETLASLVNASISLAAPDSNGGWARVQDPNAPCPCGPNAHAAVALLAACAEEALHRVKAHPPETTAAAQERPLEAVVHPESAAGFADGAEALVESEIGALRVRLRFDDRQRRDTLLVDKGGWPSAGRCANAIIPARASDAGGCAVYLDTPVRLLAPEDA